MQIKEGSRGKTAGRHRHVAGKMGFGMRETVELITIDSLDGKRSWEVCLVVAQLQHLIMTPPEHMQQLRCFMITAAACLHAL